MRDRPGDLLQNSGMEEHDSGSYGVGIRRAAAAKAERSDRISKEVVEVESDRPIEQPGPTKFEKLSRLMAKLYCRDEDKAKIWTDEV